LRPHWFGHELLRDSPALVDLTFGWVRHFAKLEGDPPPIVVNIFGKDDPLVGLADCRELYQLPRNHVRDLAFSEHGKMHILQEGSEGDEQVAKMISALTEDFEASAPPQPVAGPSSERAADAVLIVHGIRDSRGRWQRELEAEIRTTGTSVVARSIYYGYFSALSFALGSFSNYRRAMRNLAEGVTELAMEHPGARLSIVAHSNGTLLVHRLLAEHPSISLHRIYFAGCVLPSENVEQTITAFLKPGQERIGMCRSDYCVRDKPVGWLCALLRGLGAKRVGCAGYKGFHYQHEQRLVEFGPLDGDHDSAIISPDNRRTIVDFITSNDPAPAAALPDGDYDEDFDWKHRLFGAWYVSAPLIAVLVAIVGLLAGLGFWLPAWLTGASAGWWWVGGAAAVLAPVLVVLLFVAALDLI
jgi:hypothetical protein